jgi:hypothetical protein
MSLPSMAVAAAVAVSLIEIPSVTSAQEQAAAPATGGARGRGLGGGGLGRGSAGGPVIKPSALRSVPAETTAAKVTNPGWKAPRTSWGHPDLDGVWTSDDMRGIPTSRPAGQADRESLTPEEFARRAGGDEASRDRAVNQETFLRNEFGVRTYGYTSFVVDPPNGQMPSITPAAQARRKAMANVGTFGQGPFDTFDDFSLYEYSCHEGNGAVNHALSGERAYEKAVADAKAKGLPIPPRTMGMEVYSGAQVEGRQPVRELGFSK